LHNQINEYLHDRCRRNLGDVNRVHVHLHIYIPSHDCGKFAAPVIGERERKFELSGLNFDIAGSDLNSNYKTHTRATLPAFGFEYHAIGKCWMLMLRFANVSVYMNRASVSAINYLSYAWNNQRTQSHVRVSMHAIHIQTRTRTRPYAYSMNLALLTRINYVHRFILIGNEAPPGEVTSPIVNRIGRDRRRAMLKIYTGINWKWRFIHWAMYNCLTACAPNFSS